jgi:hypothetical protein
MKKLRDEVRELFNEGPQSQKNEPSRDKNKKTVSVEAFFDFGRIPIKIIASYGEWIAFYELFDSDPVYKLSFDRIRGNISRPEIRKSQELRKYSIECEVYFSFEFLTSYVLEAVRKIPSHFSGKKARGTSHGLSPREMMEVRYTSRFLYYFLKYWFKKTKAEWPEQLLKFLDEKNIQRYKPKEVTYRLISWCIFKTESFLNTNEDVDDIMDVLSERFYGEYIIIRKPSKNSTNIGRRKGVIKSQSIIKALEFIKYNPWLFDPVPPNVSFLMKILPAK